jgi:hypothetical protein
MDRSAWLHRVCAGASCAALSLACGSAAADDALPAALPASAPAIDASPAVSSMSRFATITRWSAEAKAAHPPTFDSMAIRVIELPGSNGPGALPTRRHHALSIRTETPQRMLRMMGVEASDCAAHMRMPSRIKQTREGVQASIEAQLGFSCAF